MQSKRINWMTWNKRPDSHNNIIYNLYSLYNIGGWVPWRSFQADWGSRRGGILRLYWWKAFWSRCRSHGSINTGWFQLHAAWLMKQGLIISNCLNIIDRLSTIVYQKRLFELETFAKQGEVCSFRCKAGYQTQALVKPLFSLKNDTKKWFSVELAEK